jgi:hypothetical protein
MTRSYADNSVPNPAFPWPRWIISPSTSAKPHRLQGLLDIQDRSRTAEPFPCRESVSQGDRLV